MKTLVSPLKDVPNDAWSKFVSVMSTSSITSVSASNALGAFEIMPRRLVDLGVFRSELHRARSKEGKTIWTTDNVEDRLRAEKFLRSLSLQYQVFMKSMKDYASKISSGEVKLPTDCSLSGALAVMHRAGVSGLFGKRFPTTEVVRAKANGIF